MRKLLPFIVLLAIVSCREISYKEPQPKGKKALSSVPTKLLGSYMLSDDKDNSKDTLVINTHGYIVVSDRQQKSLGDSLVVKSYKGYYFISVNENPEWLLRIIKVEKNGDLTFMSMNTNEESFNGLLRNLSQDVTIDSLKLGNEDLYQIDPTPKQLMNLIKKGYFSQIVRMQRVN